MNLNIKVSNNECNAEFYVDSDNFLHLYIYDVDSGSPISEIFEISKIDEFILTLQKLKKDKTDEK